MILLIFEHSDNSQYSFHFFRPTFFFIVSSSPFCYIFVYRAVEYAMTSTGIDVLSYHGDLNSKER